MSAEILRLASERVDELLAKYAGAVNGERVVLATIGVAPAVTVLLETGSEINPLAAKIAIDFLHSSNNDSVSGRDQEATLEVRLDLGVVNRTALVGLAAAAIGGTLGMIGEDLHPVLVGIVGAEGALALNVLAALLIDRAERRSEVDGLDLAVLSVLSNGHYSAEEVASRISQHLPADEVRTSLRKLVESGKVQTGRWRSTYTIS